MICPYCAVGFRSEWKESIAGADSRGELHTTACNCTECGQLVIRGQWHRRYTADLFIPGGDELAIFPASPLRPVPAEVTGEYARDVREAALVLDPSPKASAAISRRLLQHTIREKAGIKKRNLDEEIQALIDSNALPADLANDLRTVGNFAAHPIKSTNTGEVVDVEPGETEWLLELLEELLDFYFVRPTVRKKRRDALNAKLQGASKPDLKGTESPEPPQPRPVLG